MRYKPCPVRLPYAIALATEIRHIHKEDKSHREKLKKHFFMLLFFLLGAVVGTVFCNMINGYAILLTAVPLIVLFCMMVYYDISHDKAELEQKPLGH